MTAEDLSTRRDVQKQSGNVARRLDVLYVGPLPPYPGGSAISGALLLCELAHLGHQVRALAPFEGSPAVDTFAARHPDLEVTRFPVATFGFDHTRPLAADTRAVEWHAVQTHLEELIRMRRPDVVLIGREPFAIPVVPIAATQGLPCVLRTAGGTTLELLRERLDAAYSGQLWSAYARVDRIVSPAEHLAAGLRARALLDVDVIPNAVDLCRFTPQPKDPALLHALDIPESAVVVLHASNLVDSKRPLDVITAAVRAGRQLPHLVVVIVGDGPWRQRLEAACEASDFRERVRFTGWIPYEHMPAHLNMADIVVMPADAETQARVYLETQACGRLLLASDIPAAREVIVDGRTGLWFPMGDCHALAEQVVTAATDPRLRTRLGSAARRYVQRHELRGVVSAYAAVLENAVREPRFIRPRHGRLQRQ